LVVAIRLAISLVQSIFSSQNLEASDWVKFLCVAIAAPIVAWAAYQLSIRSVYAWGGLVKAAFDCYLPDLAKRLGYSLPSTSAKQRDFWLEVSRRAIYHDAFRCEDWPNAENSGQKGDKSGQSLDNSVSEEFKNDAEAEAEP